MYVEALLAFSFIITVVTGEEVWVRGRVRVRVMCFYHVLFEFFQCVTFGTTNRAGVCGVCGSW